MQHNNSSIRTNKTGLQLVSRPVEQVSYLGVWAKGPDGALAGRQAGRQAEI